MNKQEGPKPLLQQTPLATELLRRHTDLILHILEELNKEVHRSGGKLYPGVDSIVEREGFLKKVSPDGLSNSDVVPTRNYRAVDVSTQHLKWLADIEEVDSGKENQLQPCFISLALYPYSPKMSSRKTPYLQNAAVFDLKDKEVYSFYRKLFENVGVQKAFADYYDLVISHTIGRNYDGMKEYETKKYEKTIFLTWVRTKGKGYSHKNKFNETKPVWLTPTIDRHLSLVLVLHAIYSNYDTKCYTNLNHKSLVKLISRKCFNVNFTE